MNPKNVDDLDPKLREAYERIMGTNLSPQAPPNTTKPEQPPEQSNTPLMQTTPVVVQNPVQPPTPQNTPQSPIPSKNPFAPSPEPPLSVFNQTGPVAVGSQKKKLNFLPILLIIGGVIFFAVYVFIWSRIFGLI